MKYSQEKLINTNYKLNNRLATLDVFRCIAALAVIFFHYTSKYRTFFGHTYDKAYDFEYGYLGVHFFFLISGFVIFMTVKYSKNWSNFLYKRFTRLYPVFWLCLIITFLCMKFFGFTVRTPYYKDLLVNFTMIASFFNVRTIDGAYWSLVPEFFFYLLMALLMATAQVKKILILGLLLLVVCLINKLFWALPEKWGIVLNTSYFPLFFGGILFYKLRFEQLKKMEQCIIHSLLVVCFITCCFIFDKNAERIVIGGAFVLFYLFTYHLLDWLNFKPLVFIGKISFPLYLIHQNLGYILMNYLKVYLANYPAFLLIIIPVIFSIIVATLLHQYFEVPVIEKLRNIHSKRVRS